MEFLEVYLKEFIFFFEFQEELLIASLEDILVDSLITSEIIFKNF